MDKPEYLISSKPVTYSDDMQSLSIQTTTADFPEELSSSPKCINNFGEYVEDFRYFERSGYLKESSNGTIYSCNDAVSNILSSSLSGIPPCFNGPKKSKNKIIFPFVLTELPYLIFFPYCTYFLTTVFLMEAYKIPSIWLSAFAASLLIGLSLNATVYQTLIQSGRFNYGIMVKFFLIPFGATALISLAHKKPGEFLLVFPRDTDLLVICLVFPILVLLLLALSRVVLLYWFHIPYTLKNLLFNLDIPLI